MRRMATRLLLVLPWTLGMACGPAQGRPTLPPPEYEDPAPPTPIPAPTLTPTPRP